LSCLALEGKERKTKEKKLKGNYLTVEGSAWVGREQVEEKTTKNTKMAEKRQPPPPARFVYLSGHHHHYQRYYGPFPDNN
jgi:hypothetical protein